jgi:phosphoribosyl 1,2-cyclic phosphodiesterase
MTEAIGHSGKFRFFVWSMSVFVASLNSGSNGNCYYIGNSQDAVLIDAGISCRETEKRMRRLNLSPKNIRAIFISHEHIDHIKGVEVLSAKHDIPVYITHQTMVNGRLRIKSHLLKSFEPGVPVDINGFSVSAFTKSHDAIDPHSFIVQHNDLTIGVFTDMGYACDNLIHHFKQCHAAFLEANYDEDMLENGRYPYHLKKRISGNEGHLSNRQALDLFRMHKPAHMSHLFLSHLSKENNSPKIASDLFHAHAGGVQITVASRYEESALYPIKTVGASLPEKAEVRQAVLF